MRKIGSNELKEKEVINLCTGEKLGYISNFDIDLDDCRILSIYVSSCSGLSFFEKREEYLIPWCRIECIGEDTVLVKIQEADMSGYSCACKSHRKDKRR